MSILITTEATADLPESLLKSRDDLKVIPMGYTVNGVGYDGVDEKLSPHDFYEAVAQAKTASDLPQTSQVTAYAAEEFFTKYLEQGYDIIHVGFDSALSGTIEQEKMAAKACQEKFPDRRITVIDSLSACFGQGYLAYLTAMQNDKGLSYDEIVQYVKDTMLKVNHLFAIDDLMHLCRTGRATKNEAYLGSALHIKPVLYIPNDGKLVPYTKVISQKKAIKTLIETMQKNVLPPDQVPFVGVGSADDPESVQLLKKLVEDMGYKTVEFDVGPVIGTHVGKGMIVVIYLGKDRESITQ